MTLYLSKELRDKVKAKAASNGESVAAYTRRLWEQDLEDESVSAVVRRALEGYVR